jgi:hypothetical protein
MCASTRSIEGVRFDGGYMEEQTKLGTDWGLFLLEAKDFMQKEAERAKSLVQSDNGIITIFNSLMVKGTLNVLMIILKYFFYPGLRPGWSILQVVDPYVESHAATAILTTLK